MDSTQTSYIDPADAFFVVFVAIFTSLVSEGISWLLIYRHKEYKTLVESISNLQKKIDKQKEAQLFQGGSSQNKKVEKKLQGSENLLKEYHQDLTRSRMTSTFFVALFMMIFMSILSNAFQGVVVAKLPFEPISLMHGVTHRNIIGNDYTECSMIFIYILSNVSLRPIIQKALGFSGPRTGTPAAPGMFGQQ